MAINGVLDFVQPGVVTGDDLMKVLQYAKEQGFAIPAFNCISSTSVNAVLEGAKKANSPVMVQFSHGGAGFYGGKSLITKADKHTASIAGAVAGALHVRAMAKHYGVVVILHSDHCAKKLLPWFDGMLAANETYFKQHGVPLFSSHMLDLSEETLEENISTCERYLRRMHKIDLLLEMELGITGGEEDGVDNSHVDNSSLYSQPEEVWEVYRRLTAISPRVTIAAAFGNVHGVYKPGNVKLQPAILGNSQKYIAKKLRTGVKQPVFFVFHGGSGSDKKDIKLALTNGVIKMNVDTDTQWAYWDGVRAYEAKHRFYLQGQIGNPQGSGKPNKKKYDPRAWLRAAEQSMVVRIQESFKDLNCLNRNGSAKSKL